MNTFDSAASAAAWINGERWKGEKNGLQNTRALLAALGDPQKRMGTIWHVAGTNGKGSTCAFLDAALRELTPRVGLFTSPYLRFFNERIVFGGQPIPDEELVQAASLVREKAELLAVQGIRCTTFELLTACACVYFERMGAEHAVMEVGMGGRLDSTNVLPADISLIAMIGMDHMGSLGDTIEKIAAEKAGIFKPGVPAAVMNQDKSVLDVFACAARKTGAPLYVTSEPEVTAFDAGGCEFRLLLPCSGEIRQRVNIPGLHQAKNAALALSALDAALHSGLLSASSHESCLRAFSQGIRKAAWPGRLDMRGSVLIDCAHNPQGASALKEYAQAFFRGRRKVLLTGMMRDKQVEACAKIFSSIADEVVATRVNWPRAMDEKELAGVYPSCAGAFGSVKDALAFAQELAGPEGLVICAGSVYLAGEVINLLESSSHYEDFPH
ncbi:MAG: bifunctional folylpolyglutamate synthase/dihydrofolate synthase [Clostridia bacterium]|nr:bifunctional folylpolyglutamate synthase/dihydrofolate synthase [Clostridia bacterium]